MHKEDSENNMKDNVLTLNISSCSTYNRKSEMISVMECLRKSDSTEEMNRYKET